MKDFDVAIVGAGPAGSSSAICLARKGYSVALIDKEWFPREKLCGDFLNPINWPIFHELGVAKAILMREHEKVTTFRMTSLTGDEAEAHFPAREGETLFGLGFRRSYLDHILLEMAVSEGATVFQGCRVKELKRHTRGWGLRIDHSATVEELHARVLIGADGRNSWVAHRLGVAGRSDSQGESIGFELHLRQASGVHGTVEIHLFPGGYGGLIRLSQDTINLCFAVRTSELPEQVSFDSLSSCCLSRNRHLREILRGSDAIGEVRSTFPVYFSPRRSYGDGFLLVGDAARVTEPVTGEGVYFALKSGMLAAETVDCALHHRDVSARPLRSYDQACRRLFRLRRGVNSVIRFLMYRPALLSPLIRLSSKREQLLGSMVRLLCLPDASV